MKALVLVPMLLSLARPELALAGDDALVVRFALVVGSRDAQVHDLGKVLDWDQITDYLSNLDQDSANPEIVELFASRGLKEVTRQTARIPAAGGLVAAGAKIDDVNWKVEFSFSALEEHPRIEGLLFRNGELLAAPGVVTPYGDPALISSSEGYFMVILVHRAGANG